jgi:DNA-binding transcriptional LysR family regulator
MEGYIVGLFPNLHRPVITLKQIEALAAIAATGSFERAATKLCTSQSAVSKRIHELEAALGIPVFDREGRSARLTPRGEELLHLGREMLAVKSRILDLKDTKASTPPQLRLGVTEITALTWLPRLVASLVATFPGIVIEPEVDASQDLFARLTDGKLDLVIVPEVFSVPGILSVRLAEVSRFWAASPDLPCPHRVLSMDELASFPILMQGNRSGTGVYLDQWLRARGIMFPRVLTSDNVIALAGLAVAGLGIAYLPEHCFNPLVSSGKLRVVRTEPALPPIPYAAMFSAAHPSTLPASAAEMARAGCDFAQPFQWAVPATSRKRAMGGSRTATLAHLT